jgi:hypothetical protein
MIKSIETNYRGIKYRSRLEARWAVFFTELDISFNYEPEGYHLPSGNYLPDFYIPHQTKFPKPLWVEVKGTGTAKPLHGMLLGELVIATETRATMLFSIPAATANSAHGYGWRAGLPFFTSRSDDFYDGDSATCINTFQPEFENKLGWDYPYLFTQCPFCNKFGYEFDGRSARIGCGCDHSEICNGDKTYNSGSPQLISAYTAAKRERFGWL